MSVLIKSEISVIEKSKSTPFESFLDALADWSAAGPIQATQFIFAYTHPNDGQIIHNATDPGALLAEIENLNANEVFYDTIAISLFDDSRSNQVALTFNIKTGNIDFFSVSVDVEYKRYFVEDKGTGYFVFTNLPIIFFENMVAFVSRRGLVYKYHLCIGSTSDYKFSLGYIQNTLIKTLSTKAEAEDTIPPTTLALQYMPGLKRELVREFVYGAMFKSIQTTQNDCFYGDGNFNASHTKEYKDWLNFLKDGEGTKMLDRTADYSKAVLLLKEKILKKMENSS